jgi:hypothetical protein
MLDQPSLPLVRRRNGLFRSDRTNGIGRRWSLSAQRLRETFAAAILVGLLPGISTPALAQMDPSEHASHHPGAGAPAAPGGTTVISLDLASAGI